MLLDLIFIVHGPQPSSPDGYANRLKALDAPPLTII